MTWAFAANERHSNSRESASGHSGAPVGLLERFGLVLGCSLAGRRRLCDGADSSPGPIPGGLQGAAGNCRERPVGQGGQHGADPKARVLHPGGHIAKLPHAQAAGALTYRHLDQHAVLGADSTAARCLVGQRVPHAICDPLAPDSSDRLHHMDVMAEDKVDLGCAQQPLTNRAPAARAARASATMRRGSIVLTSHDRSRGSRPPFSA